MNQLAVNPFFTIEDQFSRNDWVAEEGMSSNSDDTRGDETRDLQEQLSEDVARELGRRLAGLLATDGVTTTPSQLLQALIQAGAVETASARPVSEVLLINRGIDPVEVDFHVRGVNA